MNGTCELARGAYFGGMYPLRLSLDYLTGCDAAATVTMRGRCACGHEREKRYCADHGQVAPPGSVWRCRPCADAGHDCPLTITGRIEDRT